jgi:hypothetical protein
MIMLALLEALIALSVMGVIVYAAYAISAGQRTRELARANTRWEATHYAAGDTTRVVVRKMVPATGRVLDEHVVAVISDQDPDYDAKFLEAMAQARARAALFTSESD